MSRYDYIKIENVSILPVNPLQARDLDGLEFQTKDLDREYLEYVICDDLMLRFIDYEYEIEETDNSFFRIRLKRKDLGVKDSNHTGIVIFYGKPYETIYIFKATFEAGKMLSIERILK